MRRSILTVAASMLMMLLSQSALAEVKLAFVDVQRAILSTEEAKRIQAQVAEEFKDEQAELRQISTDAAALMQRAQKDEEVMSADEKARISQELTDKDEEFKFRGERLQRQVNARQGELFGGMDVKLQKAIEALVLSEDYDVILPRNSALYIGDLYDITRKVTEKLNEMDKPQ
ncbi:MAG: OmpH family outer membrane protein [Pseudomonadales bacterium]|nr:OmpH family outer membrane protein [Pseudomonadales bacterium]